MKKPQRDDDSFVIISFTALSPGQVILKTTIQKGWQEKWKYCV